MHRDARQSGGTRPRNSGAIPRNYSETPPPLQARAGGSSTAPVGLFALLDEQCRLPKCTHKTFTEKIFEVHLGRVSDRDRAGQGGTGWAPSGGKITHPASFSDLLLGQRMLREVAKGRKGRDPA